jgi:tRNA-(ms[2]io[6]A)-hydroxylase
VPLPADDTLALATPPDWAARTAAHTDELLLEQAHLEKKAAAAAVTFLFRLPGDEHAQRQLSTLAREELVHFERALRLLMARGIGYRAQASSGYAEQLKKAIRKDLPGRLCDELLVAAIIEARSHERMQLLAAALAGSDAEVSAFYSELCAAEVRHERLYQELAGLVVPAAEVARRRRELAAHEASVLSALPWSARLHGGLAAALPAPAVARG